MKRFKADKVIRRLLTVSTPVRGLPDRDWIVEIHAGGVREYRACLSWKQVLGVGLIHGL